MAQGYVHPEAFRDTSWVAAHLKDPSVRVIEVDYNAAAAYNQGHVPGAVLIDYKDLSHPLIRDIVDKDGFEALMRRAGVANDTTVVLYGDTNNQIAAFALWIFKYYGHEDVRLMNGSRRKWVDEGRELGKDVPAYPETKYAVGVINYGVRAYAGEVRAGLGRKGLALVDVRSPAEYTGQLVAPPEFLAEQAQRAGHIPGAVNIPWTQALREDGTFKLPEELTALYGGKGVTPDKGVIVYCRIGERSSHTWFVLRYLLGFPNVRNYDGSWSEWGSMVNMPIER